MHHLIIVKVWAGDKDEAHSLVLDELNTSIETDHNTVGWDYVAEDSPVLITKTMLKTDYASFEEFEKKCLQERLDNMKGLEAELKNDVLPLMAPLFMTKADAPLLVNTECDELKAVIEKILKRKKDIVRPDTFEKITDAVLKVLVSVAKRDTTHSMAMWRMEQIKKLYRCIEFPQDTSNTLQCSENHYAEVGEQGKGMKPFFFYGDRHF